ncbi:response regulator [Allocoleopsis franciscana]|nr:PleD family two-component system response regulator [Allocoleopsis franciscana]
MVSEISADRCTPIQQTSPLILVADDDKITRLMLHKVLKREGYSVVEASQGDECLEVYKHTQPSLILLDAMMPVMDGFECCTTLQSFPGSEHIPVLMITALDDQASVDRAFEVGASDYITKPINLAVLRQRVRILIEKSRLYRELEQANQKLLHLATIDSLTQVSNRRSFDEYLSREWQRMAREFSPISLILCDVDFFKNYNDTYGHPCGDACLKAVARTISESVKRPADLVARYGGEEFAVILPNTEGIGAAHIAHNIQSKIRALKIPHANSDVSEYVTVSIGIASLFPTSESIADTLIAAADRALYRAKAQGRNCLIFSTNC